MGNRDRIDILVGRPSVLKKIAILVFINMEFEGDRIKLLLAGNSNEEKTAGIMLLVQLLESGKFGTDSKKIFLKEAYVLICPSFVIKLLKSTKNSRLFCQAGTSLMASSIQLGYSYVYRDFALDLVAVLFFSLTVRRSAPIDNVHTASGICPEMQFEADLLLILKWIAAESPRSTIDRILEHSLKLACKSDLPAQFFPLFLDFIGDLSQLQGSSNTAYEGVNDPTALPAASTGDLRNLLLKGFHGGAPEIIRDCSLIFCQHFLSSTSSLSPSWSVEAIKDGNTSIEPQKEKENPIGKFAMLLMSVIGIEMHLLLEEALALFKPPQGEVQTPTYGDLRDPSQERKKRYDEVKIDSTGSFVSVRLKRLTKMIPCCISLLNSTLGLLVGKESVGLTNAPAADQCLDWSALPSLAILHIRQAAHNIFQKVFDFMKEISNISQITIADVYGKINSATELQSDRIRNTLLVNIVQQSVATLCFWVLEDEDLRIAFLEHLPLLIKWSAVTFHFDTKKVTESKSSMMESLRNGVDWMAPAAISWAALTSVSEKVLVVDEGGSVGDVLHYILPCLADISSTLDDTDVLADKICFLDGGCLFTRLVNIAVLVGLNAADIVAVENGESAIRRMPRQSQNSECSSHVLSRAADSIRTCHTCASALDLLSIILSWKMKEIRILRKGDTEIEVLCALFALSADSFPRIPAAPLHSLSLDGSVQEDRHAERLADILTNANLTIGVGAKATDLSISGSVAQLGESISRLVSVLNSVSIG